MSTRKSEHQLERELLSFLEEKLGYIFIKLKGEDDIEKNLRTQLNKLNKDILTNGEMSDKEFERVLGHLMGSNVHQSAKKLRDKFDLIRDDDSTVYFNFIDFDDYTKNIFQVSNQITVFGKYENRYDVTILCNGFPIVQVELKKAGIEISKAFHQVKRYKRHSYKGLFNFAQLFVVSNEWNTRYYANANTEDELKFQFTFNWSDNENKHISDLFHFSEAFFPQKHLLEMLSEYMVMNAGTESLMVMRPYQVYAAKAMIHRALEEEENGYIWHATGSGKTLTSFKSAQVLASHKDVKKVIFLVDRQDLDNQTFDEFNNFQKGSVDETDNTKKLLEQLEDDSNTLIISTIQKMHNVVKSERNKKRIAHLENERVCFIIDECHRSTFGKMNVAIEKFFKNARFYGFTGTPRFVENRSADGRTTADIFGQSIHRYMLKDAINDNNVIPFSVEYISTITSKLDGIEGEKVEGIDTKEVLEHPDRLEDIANNILENFDKKTNHKTFNALFAVPSINVLLLYYDIFKRLTKEKNIELKFAGIFSYGANHDIDDGKEHHQDALNRIMKDYNETYNKGFSTESYGAYKADLMKKIKKNEINLVLVVNQLLTGFDSKPTNTLFIDRNFEYHDLLQAYSRTNRLHGEKKVWGNIVCYRNLKKQTDTAIKLFNNSENTDIVIQMDYGYYLERFKELLVELFTQVPTPSDVDNLEGEESRLAFIQTFRRLAKLITQMKTFVAFEFTEEEIGIDERTYEGYKTKYLDIYERLKSADELDKVSILDEIDFHIELIRTDRINVDYILNLLREANKEVREEREADIAKILADLEKSDNPQLKNKIDLIREFLLKVVPTVPLEANLAQEYEKFEDVKKEEIINEFSQEQSIAKDYLRDVITGFQFSNRFDRKDIRSELNKLNLGYMETRHMITGLEHFVTDYNNTFGLRE